MTRHSSRTLGAVPRRKPADRKKTTALRVKPIRTRDSRELEQLRALLNHSADAMMWVELPSGRILRLNAISRELLEIEARETPRITLAEILSVDAVAQIMEVAQKPPRKSGRMTVVTDAFRCPSGMVIPVEMTIGVHVVDGVTNALIVARDISDRILAEQALRDAHHKINGLIQAIPDVLYFKDVKGRNLLINEAFENLVGMPADQIVGKTDEELFPADLAKYCADSDRATVESGQSTHWEEQSVGSDGNLVYFDTIKVPLFDDKDKLIGLVGVSRDITERKRSEQALRESEVRYRTIFENIHDVYFETAIDGTVLEVSPSVERLSKYTRRELLGQSLYNLYADPMERDRIFTRILEAGYADDYEVQVKDKDGSIIRCSVSSRLERAADGTPVKTRGTLRNITERKRAEQALRESEQRYRSLFDSSSDAITIQRADIIIDCNRKALEMFQSTRDDIVGRSHARFFPPTQPDGRNSVEAAREIVLTALGGKPLMFEWMHRRPDGLVFPAEVTVNPVEIGGEVLLQCVTRDITERKRAEEALRLNELRLDALVALGQMTSASLKELADFSIEKAIEVTGSTVGYLAFMNEDETALTMYSWSHEVMAQCKIVDKPLLYPLGSTGLWGEAARQRRPVITNDYAAPLPSKKGCPDGHVLITRHLGVPIFDGNKIVAVAGVGNKVAEYNEGDIRQMTLLMSGMWRLVRRTQAEEALKDQKDRFGFILEGTNVGTWEWNVQTGEIIYNERWANIIGYSLKELAPISIDTWRRFAHPDDFDASSGALERHFRGEQHHYEIECRLKHKDGHWVWVLDRGKVVSWTEDGKPLWMYGTHQDITERKRTEQALAESELRYRSLFDNSSDTIYILRDDIIIDCNRKALEMLQCTREEMIGKSHTRFHPPTQPDGCNSADRAREVRKRALAGQAMTFEWRHRRSDGSVFPTEVSLNPVEVGGEMLLQSVVRDITERKRAEEALRDSELRYRTLYDNSADAIFIMKGEVAVDCNRRALELFGCTREQLIGKPASEFWPANQPDGRESTAAAAEDMKAAFDGQAVRFEWTHQRHDGSLFPTEVILNVVELGGERLLQAIVRDITERKEAEAALKYRSDFEKLVSEISTRFISIPRESVDSEIEAALQRICRFAGTDAACVQQFSDDHRFFAMTHISSGGAAFVHRERGRPTEIPTGGWWYRQISQGKPVAVESVDCLPDDAAGERAQLSSERIRAVVDVPLLYQGGVIGVMGLASMQAERKWSEDEVSLFQMVGQVFTNALQRKRFEEEREALEAQLRQSQKMQAVGQLAGGVAHDFNNLLQVINGYTEMAIELLPLDGQARTNLEEAARAADRAATLVRQLLTFARRETLHQQYLNLNDIISDLSKMLRRVIGEHIDLNVSSSPGLDSVYADPGQIEQILMNLCVNARDAISGAGTITIETHQQEFHADFCHEHSWAREGRFVALSVADTGSGIPEDIRERIFEPFFTTKEIGKGTGLGLATVYAITERHGGFIRVESTPGQGSRFTFYFPAVQAEQMATEVPVTEPPRAGGGETVLLAEDDEMVRELTVRILERAGYRVIVARDGEEAVELFQTHKAKIVLAIIDVVMPKKGGRDVYEIIRQSSPDLPVLFSSGYSYDDLGDTAVRGDHVGQIQKPFRPGDLLKSIQDMLVAATR